MIEIHSVEEKAKILFEKWLPEWEFVEFRDADGHHLGISQKVTLTKGSNQEIVEKISKLFTDTVAFQNQKAAYDKLRKKVKELEIRNEELRETLERLVGGKA